MDQTTFSAPRPARPRQPSRPIRAIQASCPRPRGVTLIELMIAVAIVAILMAVALPSYRDQVRRSTRAEAQAYLMSVASRQQQFLVDTRAYAATLDAVGVPVPSSTASNYTRSMPTPGTAPPSFTVTLTPTGNQASDRCGALSINQAGTKTAAVAGCW